ncbi:CHRD domain-containing protein [Chitinophaga polysaccharea]|uniref:CHRD domain-containing protein n=1 Tax=Chitinophaga TaxID=79328 RepID=UPI001455960C|nr:MULTISPECIES: CHRD domain-containing protein [Chitinophaga]NLR58148.1 CHRD domain-containing protein [Chitinophaga polysaccharea]NLU90687.1 CHRD domain-containing protein [Chitinophaga sp. Ak27]
MKKVSFSRLWRRQWFAYSSLFFAVCMAACSGGGYSSSGNPGGGNTYTVSATLTGAQETPANSSTGTGTLTGTYDPATYKLSFTLSWSKISGVPTGMHFHGPGAAGVAAPVVFAITGFPSAVTGTVSGTVTLSAGQAGDLLSGRWYVNIHTANFPNGEIRGQLSTSVMTTNPGGTNPGGTPGY